MARKLSTWRDVPRAGMILEPGNSVEYETGSWRTYRPMLIAENCIHCMTCFLYCPDSSIKVEKGKMAGFDYAHCKGCGICSNICPAKKKAIEMKLETECQ